MNMQKRVSMTKIATITYHNDEVKTPARRQPLTYIRVKQPASCLLVK